MARQGARRSSERRQDGEDSLLLHTHWRRLVAGSGVLLAVWEVLGRHVLMSRLSMQVLHPLSVVVELVILALVSRVVFRVIDSYHRDLVSAYADLRAAEMLRDDMMHMVVHDMKNPLSVVLACHEALGSYIQNDPSARMLDEAVGEAAADLSRMVSNLLDISQLEQGVITPQARSIGTLTALESAANQLRPLAALHSVQIRAEVHADATVVCADFDLLQRVLANIVGNALKHAPRHSEVVLEATMTSRGTVELAVHDSGPGVPEELHAAIFEKYRRATTDRKYSSRDSGLGLAFCKLAVEAHGGSIGVRNRDGAGATFYLTLPLAPGTPEGDPLSSGEH